MVVVFLTVVVATFTVVLMVVDSVVMGSVDVDDGSASVVVELMVCVTSPDSVAAISVVDTISGISWSSAAVVTLSSLSSGSAESDPLTAGIDVEEMSLMGLTSNSGSWTGPEIGHTAQPSRGLSV